jgi:uncharacterized RmlC-like cupin family protein
LRNSSSVGASDIKANVVAMKPKNNNQCPQKCENEAFVSLKEQTHACTGERMNDSSTLATYGSQTKAESGSAHQRAVKSDNKVEC